MNLPIIYQKSVGKYGKLCGFMKKTNFKNLQKPMEIKPLKVYNNSQIKENSSGQGDPDEAAKLSPREFPIGGTVRKPQG